MGFLFAVAVSLASGAALGSDAGPELVSCRSVTHHGEATIEIAQTLRLRGDGSPHLCKAEVTVRGPVGETRQVYADIEAVGDAHYGVTIVPDTIGGYRAIAKFGDYDGRLLLVNKGGGVINLPGPSHYLAYGRFLLVEYHSDGYAITVFDVSAGMQVFAADAAVLAHFLGRQAGDPPRWIQLRGAIYLFPSLESGQVGSALRLDKKHGGLVPVRLSADDAARAEPVNFLGLASGGCTCGAGPSQSSPR